MHLENCLEDLRVVSNTLATVTSSVSRFLNDKPKSKAKTSGRIVLEVRAYKRFRGTLTPTAKYTGFTERDYVKTEGIPVQEHDVASELVDFEKKLNLLTAKHVQIARILCGLTAEQILEHYSESDYEGLQNVVGVIRSLEFVVNKFTNEAAQPHPYLKKLSHVITEYRLAVSDVLMILDQCFNEVNVIESQTGLIDEDVFANFSLH